MAADRSLDNLTGVWQSTHQRNGVDAALGLLGILGIWGRVWRIGFGSSDCFWCRNGGSKHRPIFCPGGMLALGRHETRCIRRPTGSGIRDRPFRRPLIAHCCCGPLTYKGLRGATADQRHQRQQQAPHQPRYTQPTKQSSGSELHLVLTQAKSSRAATAIKHTSLSL